MEPEQLRLGKLFHRRVQTDWAGTIEGAAVSSEHSVRFIYASRSTKQTNRGRVDIFVNKIDDFVTVIEIKSTNWDTVKSNRKRLLDSHCRQTLKYIDEYLNIEAVNVCAAIIYPKSPISKGIKLEVEDYWNQNSFQVLWFEDQKTNQEFFIKDS
ncbi:MAG TPA: hypothetical protein VFG10_17770 [Saprospiraceae bacterium]|nr:hypothetical protein [Saprospiraceae bacterium]